MLGLSAQHGTLFAARSNTDGTPGRCTEHDTVPCQAICAIISSAHAYSQHRIDPMCNTLQISRLQFYICDRLSARHHGSLMARVRLAQEKFRGGREEGSRMQ